MKGICLLQRLNKLTNTDLIYKLAQYFSTGICQTITHKSFTKFLPTHIGLKWNSVKYKKLFKINMLKLLCNSFLPKMLHIFIDGILLLMAISAIRSK